jgi:competence protein ComEA
MPRPGRTELLVYIGCAAVVIAVGLHALIGARGSSATPSEQRSSATTTPVVRRPAAPAALVHVVGAVRRAGVYRVSSDARVRDAIRQAGGPTARADLQGVNLAAKISDAQQVIVPERVTAAAATASSGAGPAVPAGASAAGAPVSLNTATAEQLETLDGVGPATSRKILEYRAAKGGFRSVDDLASIPGIGPKRLAALRPRVRV